MRTTTTIAIALGLSINAVSQQYTICNWFNDYQAAMVQTYDDMNSDHINICTPQLVARGMGGTLFVDYDAPGHVTLSGGWQGLMDAVDQGIEMANHTQNHANLSSLKDNASQLESEISTFRDFLNSNITNQNCNTFAYPYGNGNEFSTVRNEIMKGHIGARDAGFPGMAPWGWSNDWLYDFGATEDEYFFIPTIAEHFMMPDVAGKVNELLTDGGLMTVMWHAIVSSTHESFLDQVVTASGGKVWFPNFRDAIKYHRERRTATLNTLSENSGLWQLELTDTLTDNATFNHPLTIKIKTEGRTILSVKQNNKDLAYSIDNDEIQFNAVPDAGVIEINSPNPTNSNFSIKNVIGEVFPNPAQNFLTVTIKGGNEMYLNVYDQLGNLIIVKEGLRSINTVDISFLSKGVYYLKVFDEGRLIQNRTSFIKI